MSGSIGANRIPRDAVEKTLKAFTDKVLKKFPGFKTAKISGSYNTTVKPDHGDLDLIIHIEGEETDKKKLKQSFASYLNSLPDDIIPPFKSGRHVGKKSAGTGDIVITQFPIEGYPDLTVQIDNMIVMSEQESEYRKSFLDLPAEKQGLLVGLAKAILLEESPAEIFKRLGISNIPELDKNQEFEFNLSNKGLTLRLVTLGDGFKEVGRTDIWNSFDWSDVEKLFKNYNLKGTWEDLLSDIKSKLKNPRSKNRVKGVFNSLVVINAGEEGTPKGDAKLKAKDTVSSMLEYFMQIGKSIGRSIVKEIEADEDTIKPGICFYPGAFKPPHKGHFEVAKDLSSRVGQITALKIIISPKERQGITAQQSLDIWKKYLEANPLPNTTVEIAKSASPITDAYDYIKAHPGEQFYIAGGKDEVDDLGYFTALTKAFGDRVVPIPVTEKFGRISASYVRGLLRAGDLKGFKQAIPDAAVTKGMGEEIFKDLATTVTDKPLKENIEHSSVPQDIVATLTKFLNWCLEMLEIDNIPEVTFIASPEFTLKNQSFGGYEPISNTIQLSIYNRNPVDIMRTLAHELVHCKQNQLTGISFEDGKTGSDVENEANAVAGMIMRTYGRKNPEIFNSNVYEGAPGTFKAKITRTYGGPATIAKAQKFKARKNATTLDKKQANWFINMHSKNESMTPDELQKVDDFADQVLAPVDIDLTSNHVLDRLTGRESDVTYDQLIRFFEKLAKKKKEFIDFFNRYSEIVATDRQSKLNIPFLNLTKKAIAKTIMRKPNFLTHTPQLTFEKKDNNAKR